MTNSESIEPLKANDYSNFRVISEGFYEFITFDSDDYYKNTELHGVIDCYGGEIVPPYYDFIAPVNYENLIYFIAIKYGVYLYDQKGNSTEGVLLQYCGPNQYYKFKIEDNKEILISVNGEIIIPPLYDNIEDIGFKFGWLKVKKNNLWGIWKNDRELIKPKYDDIFHEEHKLLLPNKIYYELNGDAYGFHNNNLHAIILREKDKLGIIDCSEKFILPKYQGIQIIDSGYLAIKETDKWGVINRDEEIIIPPQYEEFDFDFLANIFIVQKEGSYGCINIKNEIIIPLIYNNIICDCDNEKLYARKKDKQFVFDFKGKIISESNLVNYLYTGYEKSKIALEYDSRNINLFDE